MQLQHPFHPLQLTVKLDFTVPQEAWNPYLVNLVNIKHKLLRAVALLA